MLEMQTTPKIKVGWALMRVSTKEQAKVHTDRWSNSATCSSAGLCNKVKSPTRATT